MAKAISGRHRVINGKQFFKVKIFSTEGAADIRADKLRSTGRYLVRVLKDDDGFAVFCFLK